MGSIVIAGYLCQEILLLYSYLSRIQHLQPKIRQWRMAPRRHLWFVLPTSGPTLMGAKYSLWLHS